MTAIGIQDAVESTRARLLLQRVHWNFSEFALKAASEDAPDHKSQELLVRTSAPASRALQGTPEIYTKIEDDPARLDI
jgi:hypothetical protein